MRLAGFMGWDVTAWLMRRWLCAAYQVHQVYGVHSCEQYAMA